MDIFLLGAGRPALGDKPSALKNITLNTKAMDWQIHSFEDVALLDEIHYLGGYHVDEVINSYPKLNYTVIPDWQKHNVLYSLLKAPFSGGPAICAYSDTIFRKTLLSEILSIDADIVFCVDSQWKHRFDSRTAEDIGAAETMVVPLEGTDREVEFTGLIYFSSPAVSKLVSLKQAEIGKNLIDLLSYLKGLGLSLRPYDVAGEWAEFNAPADVSHFILGTKSETLARLEPLVKHSHIGRQVSFTSEYWKKHPKKVLGELRSVFGEAALVVRSSSVSEDGWYSSNAGGFESLLNIDGADASAVDAAINTVIASYGDKASHEDQVLVQALLSKVRLSGVVFTCSIESGAPYYHFNFDDKTQSTETVTAGLSNDLRTVVLSRFEPQALEKIAPELLPVLTAVQELEQLLAYDRLDVEFAVDEDGTVHIFQARPITVDHSNFEINLLSLKQSLKASETCFSAWQKPSPFVFGQKSIFANMPDWNPAEIIGVKPKPLAFSLYCELITNDIWARQRKEYGYRDLMPCSLMLSFSDQPYIDVRASFNSFIPANIPSASAARFVEAYIQILEENPHFHDKVEFEIAFTIWTPDFSESAKSRLCPYGVLEADIELLEDALKRLTAEALTRLDVDTHSVNFMHDRRNALLQSSLPRVDKCLALLDDCKQYGTLAFSHAARAGFVAITLLNSFVRMNVISDTRRLAFLQSFSTVAGEIEQDKYAYSQGNLSADILVERYGHLRPGTYELSAQAYWEDPEHYLFSGAGHSPAKKSDFAFTEAEEEKLKETLKPLDASLSIDELTQFLITAIQCRESVKFEFSRNLSAALDVCIDYGKQLGISRDELSYLTISDLQHLKLNTLSIDVLNQQLESRKQNYKISSVIELPSIIGQASDIYCFERLSSQPNFVTSNKVIADIVCLSKNSNDDIKGKIVLIPQADPGYDWLFGHGIAGLITQYGGANSHMAIRSSEIGLPSAIGVGQKMYEKIAAMKRVNLDCANKIIEELQ